MPVVWIRVPQVNIDSKGRPRSCPYCESSILQRWGAVTQPVNGSPQPASPVYRYRCSDCGHTFRHYTDPADHRGFDQQVRQVAGLLWALGLSIRQSVDLLALLGVEISRMTVWREGQSIREKLDSGIHSDFRRLYIDRQYIHRVSNKLGVVIALDLGHQRTAVVGTVDEYNPMRVKALLNEMVADVEIEIQVHSTGTLDTCRGIVDQPGQRSDLS